MQPMEATTQRQSKLFLVGDAVSSSRSPQGPGPWVIVGSVCLVPDRDARVDIPAADSVDI